MGQFKPGHKKTGGRQKGTPNKRTVERQRMLDKAKLDGTDPMSFAVSILRDPNMPFKERQWAAEQLFPYSHPKLSSIESRTGGATHEERLEMLRKLEEDD